MGKFEINQPIIDYDGISPEQIQRLGEVQRDIVSVFGTPFLAIHTRTLKDGTRIIANATAASYSGVGFNLLVRVHPDCLQFDVWVPHPSTSNYMQRVALPINHPMLSVRVRVIEAVISLVDSILHTDPDRKLEVLHLGDAAELASNHSDWIQP